MKEWAKKQIKLRYNSFYEMLDTHFDKEQLHKNIINQFLTLISNHIGILSLSKIDNNLLLWSHYSNCHQGIVIEFEDEHPFLTQFENKDHQDRIEIEYTDIRPDLKLNNWNMSQENALEMAKKILFTKSTEWRYEQEYRLVRSLNNATHLNCKDNNGFDIYVFDFPTEIIKSIIFGCRVNEENKKYLMESLSKSGFDSVEIKQAVLNKDKFSLEIN